MTGDNRLPVDALGPRTRIGSGGQGTVYAVPRTVIGPAAYKSYNARILGSVDTAALAAMVGYPVGRYLCDRVAWPAALVEENGAVTGFLMRWPAGYRQVRLLLNGDRYLADRELPVHDRFRVRFLRDTAETLELLHRLRIAVGDLSPDNLLFSLTSRPRCFFIDCDAMRVRGRSVLTQVQTADWEVPAGEELATSHSDAYKFGLLAIRLFAGDQRTRDPVVLQRVSPELAVLAARSLSAVPAQRPRPADWLAALDAAVPVAGLSPPGHVVTTAGTVRQGSRPVRRPPRIPPRPPVATRPPAGPRVC